MSILERKCFVFPSQRGTFYSPSLRLSSSLRIAWVASRLARPAATHSVSRIFRDQDGASQLSELRKLTAGGLQAHAVAVKVHQVARSRYGRGGLYSGRLTRAEQEANLVASAGRAGKNGRALVGPRQGIFCRLPQASREDQGGLQL